MPMTARSGRASLAPMTAGRSNHRIEIRGREESARRMDGHQFRDRNGVIAVSATTMPSSGQPRAHARRRNAAGDASPESWRAIPLDSDAVGGDLLSQRRQRVPRGRHRGERGTECHQDGARIALERDRHGIVRAEDARVDVDVNEVFGRLAPRCRSESRERVPTASRQSQSRNAFSSAGTAAGPSAKPACNG